MSHWAPHAWLPSGIASDVRVSVTDGLITSVETGVRPAAGDRRLPGVLLPGLANAHSHAFHRALRGRTHADGGSFWTWRTVMYDVARRLDPDSYLALARAVYAEMALAGITTVGEFHYLHHDTGGRRYSDPNAMGEALRQAAAEAGVRLTLLDTCYLAGGLTGSGHTALEDVQLRFGDGDAEQWASRVSDLKPSAGMRIGAAAHSVRAVPAEQLRTVADFTGGTAPLHVHLSEQPAENEACQAFYGLTPTALLRREGVLGPSSSMIHATHLTATDITDLNGTFACFCPTTERDLADGIGPARALTEAGATITLGSDQHAVVDLFEEARGLEMHERLSTRQRGRFSPAELLTALTSDGHRSLGWPELGRIQAGAPADLVAVRLDSVRTAGSRPEQVALSATAADVDTVLVGGETVVSEGRHRLGDVGRLFTEVLEKLSS
ncbi:formimidoylglutamate deiminase [Kineosporia sp. J2-2]|uniref:Formimidoylglutamate deiminase n=1 Tax=Kineosporia corallincola TaxID=2835133 RepID=A0ABS5T8K1_9ACTN|nr:formimidoylglutamate deiminase [Kineosporia corallincola]MBT0767401.1 formimidoylglutamate deiminase [Kineosporia corallincola]